MVSSPPTKLVEVQEACEQKSNISPTLPRACYYVNTNNATNIFAQEHYLLCEIDVSKTESP